MEQSNQELSIIEQEIRLAEARAEELREKQRLAEQQRLINEGSEQRKQAAFLTNLMHEIRAAGLEPNPDLDITDFQTMVSSAFKYEVAGDGSFTIRTQTGQDANIELALLGWAEKHPKYFDQNSLRTLQTTPDKLCKSQMSMAQKVRYIEKFGDEAYGRLPFNSPTEEVPVDEMTTAIWNTLPNSRKSQILSERGVEWLQDMLRRTGRVGR